MFSPRSARRRNARAGIALLAVSTVLLAGCSVGPDTGPDVVRGDGAQGDNATAAPKQPELDVPTTELNWRKCTNLPAGYPAPGEMSATIECARFDVPAEPGRAGSQAISVGAMRAKTARTPHDAAPLVLTSGSDLPSSRTLLSLAVGDGNPMLDQRPIVAVDFRGTGIGASIDCLSVAQRAVLSTGDAGSGRDVAQRAAAVGTAARAGADLCSDALSPLQLAFSVDTAAADLEELRTRWGVERLALIGVGDGSSVALRYAATHPDHLGRLILDSPSGYLLPAREATSVRARGVQKTLATFAERCSAAGCSFGTAGVGTITRVLNAAAKGEIDGLSDVEILHAITTTLALDDTAPDGLRRLRDAITDAESGNTASLRRMVATARDLRGTDGRLVARCNDLRGRPGLQEISAFATELSSEAPTVATPFALALAECDGWGSTEAPTAPESLPVDPLILIGQNDPFNGAAAVDTLTSVLQKAKTSPTSVSWDGLGFSVLAHSTCAADVVREYLGDVPLAAPRQRTCPA